jgi:predicted adenylyl cyclase CyaB
VPTNLELKAHCSSLSRAEEQARKAGAEERALLRQTDTYLKARNRRLKLRETEGESAELIAYERAEDSLERWSEYTKVTIADPARFHEAAEKAGVLVVVRKERKLYLYRGARIHLDSVEGLGSFIEFEVPSDGAADPPTLMKELRKIFGVREKDIERGSYSDLLLAKSSHAKP